MRYNTEGLPKALEEMFDKDMEKLVLKHHDLCKQLVQNFVEGPLARLKFGKLVMGMGDYWIEGTVSAIDQYGEEFTRPIHELNTLDERSWTEEFDLLQDEAVALKQLFAVLDFWLELSGGADMEL